MDLDDLLDLIRTTDQKILEKHTQVALWGRKNNISCEQLAFGSRLFGLIGFSTSMVTALNLGYDANHPSLEGNGVLTLAPYLLTSGWDFGDSLERQYSKEETRPENILSRFRRGARFGLVLMSGFVGATSLYLFHQDYDPYYLPALGAAADMLGLASSFYLKGIDPADLEEIEETELDYSRSEI